ncbi:hypothetical protein DCO57_00540 [Labrenzia sp. 011]|nr:hypothetical protein DCO57_00540 [Labrenzia sp. 011]
MSAGRWLCSSLWRGMAVSCRICPGIIREKHTSP